MAGRLALLAAMAAVAAAVAALVLAVHTPAGKSSMTVVRVGTLRGGVSSLDVILSERLDSKYGFKVKPLYFTSTLDLANALAKGDIDVAVIPAEFVAKLREKGVNVTILAVDFYQNQAVVARPGVKARSIMELKGMRLGAFKPTGTYAMFKAYMKLIYNVSNVEEFFRVVNAPPPQLVQAFERGDVDAIVIWEPFVSRLVADYNGSIVVSFSKLWRMWKGHVGSNGVMIVYAARAGWAAGHPQLVGKLLKARAEAAREWNSNESLATSILVEGYGLTGGAARLCWERLKMVESEKLTRETVENIMAVWRLAREGGYISSSPEELAGGLAFWVGR